MREFEKVKGGQTVSKGYHPLWLDSGLLRVLVGRNAPGPDALSVRMLRRQGWDCCRFPITDEVLKEIESGDTVPTGVYHAQPQRNLLAPPGGRFTVSVILERRLRAMKEASP